MLTFQVDGCTVKVISARDQYNDYSVAFDVIVQVVYPVQVDFCFTSKGDDLNSIVQAYLEHVKDL